MRYAEATDLIQRFGKQELVDVMPGEAPETFEESLVLVALADATEEMDTYLGERFTLPLASVPDILVQVACDIARYKYHSHMPTDEIEKRYNARIEWLKQVVKGNAGLGDVGETSSSLTGSYTKKTKSDRLFNCDNLNGF